VTVVNPFGPLDATTDELLTYNGVKPGDRIVVCARLAAATAGELHARRAGGLARSTALSPAYELRRSRPRDRGRRGAGWWSVTLRGCGAIVDMLVETFDASGLSLSCCTSLMLRFTMR